MSKKIRLLLTVFFLSAITISLLFFIARMLYVFGTEVQWYEKSALVILFMVEVFILIHSVGYIIEVLRVIITNKEIETEIPKIANPPSVAILIPGYKEPLHVIYDTLVCCNVLSYPNKQIFFLDDTRYDLPEEQTKEMEKYKNDLEKMCEEMCVNIFRHKWRGAKAGILNDFIDFCEGKKKKGSFCIYNKKGAKDLSSKYIAVLDVDQNPFIDFLEPIIAKLEKDPKLAFVQTPQYYTNFNKSRVANAAGIQQAVFYEYICEGKGVLSAVLCCGTNVVYREKALYSVGKFDEVSVTEDVATSLEFHIRKWKSHYLSRIAVFGMGPENLFAYFTQQYRWALGTLGVMRKLVLILFKNPRALPWYLWWEYFLSSSFYLIGYGFVIISLFPMMFILFNFPSFVSVPSFYSLIFLPYLVITFMAFIWSVKGRGYSFKDIIKGQWLLLATFPIYIKAATNAILNRLGHFRITSKEGKFTIPLRQLWPQLFFIGLSFFSTIWGINRIYFAREPFNTLCFNTFWCFYNFVIVFSIISFNYIGSTKEYADK